MTQRQIQLVRDSFKLVKPVADQAAATFYEKLFELDPRLRPMFPATLEEQGQKLMQMLGAAVALLDKPGALKGALEGLGRRHAGYGVRDEHYVTVGKALLGTLESGLGPAFTSEVKEAWTALYDVVASTMQGAATAGVEAIAA